ncbi:DnaJ-domain-containing protein [Cutaneotrichosporon oleaginosum]|uniref:DnaJ-domain-containing protein n=1 Tax=Cutaneotrichosporon oleaginosum TaxID=879819 RepID=A0A0J0XTQ1_9TREE|nr:DnaJ-domain-containing protein [Cutaneotrichosporon oleaginosum]KLT44453.1 DnaJ-domain-containing protein [Cutaneotrichosporon oleaginosum]TXT07828.1 hypothetical protein COLE_04752 [Cutaneotrichosporon oleaginosum]
MRVSFYALFALICALTAYAFDALDHEVFDLVAALEASEGKGTSFYSFLGVEPSASNAQITKAYRKRSLELHPDKNPGVANIQERFARLGVIAQILRDSTKRERYNFYYKNGVPTWKGLGYAYSRWRPGLGFVLVFLTLLTSGLHYVVLRMNYTRDTRRVTYFTEAARKAASGAKGRRKVRVPMVEGMVGGESLELVVDGGTVLLPHADGTATPLSSLAPEPSLSKTWPAQLSRGVWAKLAKKQIGDEAELEDEEEETSASEVEGYDVQEGTPTPAPRKSRAAELRAQRLKKDSPGTSTAETTEGEEDSAASGAEGRRKKVGGKAAGARRRKMGMKK